MGIDGIGGKAAGFWARAKSALAGSTSSEPSAPRPRGDTAQLSGADRVFAGYAMPVPPPAAEEPPVHPPSDQPTEAASEAKLWAPLVITPPD